MNERLSVLGRGWGRSGDGYAGVVSPTLLEQNSCDTVVGMGEGIKEYGEGGHRHVQPFVIFKINMVMTMHDDGDTDEMLK